MTDWTQEEDEAFNDVEKHSNLGKQILREIGQPYHFQKRKQLTGEMLVRAAQASLSPEQYDHFEAMSKHQPDIYDRLAYAIGIQDE
jgi:hypothetical protein